MFCEVEDTITLTLCCSILFDLSLPATRHERGSSLELGPAHQDFVH
jgi:hypothetical protein